MAAPKQPRIFLTDAEKAFLLRIPAPEPITAAEIRAFRRRHHLRVDDLGRLLGIDPLTITRWENGRPLKGYATATYRYGAMMRLALCEVERRLEDIR